LFVERAHRQTRHTNLRVVLLTQLFYELDQLIYWDGKKVIEASDKTFPDAGRVEIGQEPIRSHTSTTSA
jgi:hypothetical protein